MSTPTTRVTDAPMTFRAQLIVLWHYRRLIVLGIAIGIVGALALALLPGDRYTATANVLVRVPSQTALTSGDVTKQISMQTEIEVAESERVAEGVATSAGVAEDPDELSKNLRVTNPPDTTILRFSYTDVDAEHAAEMANAFAKSYLEDRESRTLRTVNDQVAILNGELGTLDKKLSALDKEISDAPAGTDTTTLVAQRNGVEQQALNIRGRLIDTRILETTPGYLVRAASPPGVPDGPSLSTMLVLGAIVGLVLGVALAWVVGWLRRGEPNIDPLTVHTGVEVLTTLRRLDLRPGMDDGKPIRASEPASTLALTLAYGREMEKVRSILVAETRATDGARSVAVDLALALVEMGRNVALVEADFRLPMLATVLPFVPNPDARAHVNLFDNGERRVGLGWGESSTDPLEVRVIGPGRLHLFPGGADGRPLETLNRPGIQEFVTGLRDEYDFVVVVAPGLLTYVDGLELMHLMDGALLVSDARDWSAPDLEAATGYVRRVGGRLVGAIRVVGSARIIS